MCRFFKLCRGSCVTKRLCALLMPCPPCLRRRYRASEPNHRRGKPGPEEGQGAKAKPSKGGRLVPTRTLRGLCLRPGTTAR